MNRFRIILPCLLSLAAFTPEAGAQLRYGFRFGGVFADASLKDAGDCRLDNRSGFSGGLALEYQLPKCGLAADIAVLYTRYNTRISNEGAAPQSFGRDFIEIPLHLKYKFWLPAFHNLFGPMVYTGPSVMTRAGNAGHAVVSADRIQPGWDVGIGFDIVNFLQISGGYRFGLGNAAKASGQYPDASLRTDAWSISATLLFDF